MATRNTKPKESAIDDEVLQQAVALLSDDTFSGESLNPALEALYAEMGMTGEGEATVHITKLNADGRGAEAHIWRGAPEDYELERIAKQFGSGDYRVKVYVRVPTGQKVSKGNKVFTWLLSPEEEAKRQNPQPIQSPQINSADIARMVAEAVRAAIPAMPPQPDPFDQMQKLATIMQVMRPEPVNPPQHDPMVIMERVLQMQNMMRDSMPERDEAPVPGGANTNDLLLGVIKSFGPMFAQVLTANPAGGAQQMQEADAPQLTHNPQAVVAPAPQASQPANPVEEDVNLKLKMGMSFLVMQCDAGGEPITYAEVVIDSVPSETLQMLVNDPDAINKLIAIDKRIEEPVRKVWFENLLQEVKGIITSEGEDNAPAN